MLDRPLHNWLNYKTGQVEQFDQYPPLDRVLEFVPQDAETQQQVEMQLADRWPVRRILSKYWLRPMKED